MNRDRFQEIHREEWQQLENILNGLGRKRGKASATELPALYRRVCQSLAVAKHRYYGTDLIRRLNRLALRGHDCLYRSRPSFWAQLAEFVSSSFPRQIRANWPLLCVSMLLFYGPILVMAFFVHRQPELAYSFADTETLQQLESMYDPASDHFLRERESESDVLMFGFYIRNNIGVAFRTFAGGILFGIGSILVLLFNGLFLGTAVGHILHVGYSETFFPFVIGHGALELNAIVLAGVAGLKIGFAPIAPGRLSRVNALVAAGRESVPIVYGAAGMLLLAAFLEAFWSSSTTLPSTVKYGVGAFLWFFVLIYFLLCGKNHGA